MKITDARKAGEDSKIFSADLQELDTRPPRRSQQEVEQIDFSCVYGFNDDKEPTSNLMMGTKKKTTDEIKETTTKTNKGLEMKAFDTQGHLQPH